VDEVAEPVVQACRVEGELPVVFVDVELAALCAGPGRGLGLVDGRRDAVDVQDAGEREPAEPSADDRDHSASLERCSISLEQRSRDVKMGA
jgi:hypothetical protein